MKGKFSIKLLLGLSMAMFAILALPVHTHAQLTRGAVTGTVRARKMRLLAKWAPGLRRTRARLLAEAHERGGRE